MCIRDRYYANLTGGLGAPGTGAISPREAAKKAAARGGGGSGYRIGAYSAKEHEIDITRPVTGLALAATDASHGVLNFATALGNATSILKVLVGGQGTLTAADRARLGRGGAQSRLQAMQGMR